MNEDIYVQEEQPEYYDIIPEYNSAGRLCNYHTGEGKKVRVMTEEWERFIELAGRRHEVVDGIVRYNSELEPTMPDAPPPSADDAVKTLLLGQLGVAVDDEALIAAQASLVEASGAEITSALSGDWQPSEWVTVGGIRIYEGIVYECLQAHSTQAGWRPDLTPSLWRAKEAEGETQWQSNVAYKVGDVRTYNGVEYRCIQAHTSQESWAPSITPALWAAVE